MRPRRGGQVAAALGLDAVLGEPPETVHPTVLMVLALSLPSLVFVSTRKILSVAPRKPGWILGAVLISTSLSMRGLAEAAEAVEMGLREGRLERARTRVRHLVGRDTDDLSEPEICRAVVESVAENTSDGVVAPMFYGAL